MTALSVIIPALNEAENLPRTLAALARASGAEAIELIVADGGSVDATVSLAEEAGAKVVVSPCGRGRQMNAGAAAASGENLLFLHADTLLPADFPQLIEEALAGPDTAAGAFSLAIAGDDRGLAAIAWLANLRSRLLHLPYGDQALFTTRAMFAAVGGFPEIPIMEDYVFIRQLNRRGRIVILPARAVTSARRWQRIGIFRTTLINQLMVCGFTLGVSPTTLARWYQRLRGLAKAPDPR